MPRVIRKAARGGEQEGDDRDDDDRALAAGRDGRGADRRRLAEFLGLGLDGLILLEERLEGRQGDRSGWRARGHVALADELDGAGDRRLELLAGGLVGHQALGMSSTARRRASASDSANASPSLLVPGRSSRSSSSAESPSMIASASASSASRAAISIDMICSSSTAPRLASAV